MIRLASQLKAIPVFVGRSGTYYFGSCTNVSCLIYLIAVACWSAAVCRLYPKKTLFMEVKGSTCYSIIRPYFTSILGFISFRFGHDNESVDNLSFYVFDERLQTGRTSTVHKLTFHLNICFKTQIIKPPKFINLFLYIGVWYKLLTALMYQFLLIWINRKRWKKFNVRCTLMSNINLND